MVRHSGDQEVAGLGLGTAVLFVAATGTGSFLSTVLTPAAVLRWGRYRTANGALVLAALIQLLAAWLYMPVMIACGFVLGAAGQVVKLCADSAMQIDVEDALRGHVFTVQDALFWFTFAALTSHAVKSGFVDVSSRSSAMPTTLTVMGSTALGVFAAANSPRLRGSCTRPL